MIPEPRLQRVVLEVAVARFGDGTFSRPQLREAVEARLRTEGEWTRVDDAASQSIDPKSKGQANIDWRITDLAGLKLISSVRRNCWRVGPSEAGGNGDGQPPPHIPTTILRTVRDTALGKLIKQQCSFLCQVCRMPLAGTDGSKYAEAHHVRPLAKRHGGLDRADNILVLCPNHHVLFHLGVPEFISPTTIRIGDDQFTLTPDPELAPDNVEFHNTTMRRN